MYTDEQFDSKDDALAYLQTLGVTEIIDQAHGSAVLVTPIDPEAGFGAADQYDLSSPAGRHVQSGYSQSGEDGSVYYADNTYFGGLTYRYAIGIGGGADFLCDYVAPHAGLCRPPCRHCCWSIRPWTMRWMCLCPCRCIW